MTTLTDLERLARAATPGTWAHHSSESVRICDDAHDSVAGCRTIVEAEVIGYERKQSVANAAYIAALSPERVLAMIACIEMLTEDADEPCAYGDNCQSFVKLKHYRCRPCHSRAALAALDKEQT